MGDADETIMCPKGTGDDEDTPSVSSQPDIDMINLSSQITGIELVSRQTRRGKKRVKFFLPEGEPTTNGDKTCEYRRREVGEYLKAKRRVIKVFKQQLHDTELEDIDEQKASPNSTEKKGVNYMFEIHEDNIIQAKRRKQDTHANLNTNCAIKDGASSKKKHVNKRPSKSSECMSQKKMKVVRDDSCNMRAILGDEQRVEVASILNDFSSMEGKDLQLNRNKPSSTTNKGKNNNSLKSLYQKHKDKKLSKKSKTKCHKSLVKIKAKITANKLKKSKDTKGKSLIKKARLQCKKALKRKQNLKHKLAQERKVRKNKLAKKKEKKIRKVRIIPIEREEEVSECLRVNLLKFLTFESAYDYKLECCRDLCWDNWKDLDIDDVIGDFD